MMKDLQGLTDKSAIGLSILCAFHCLALPSLLVLFPSLAGLHLDNEAFHLWMILAVIPTSAYALLVGCRQHQANHLIIFGALGIASLLTAVLWGEELLWGQGETLLTLFGAALLALVHLSNFRRCRQSRCAH